MHHIPVEAVLTQGGREHTVTFELATAGQRGVVFDDWTSTSTTEAYLQTAAEDLDHSIRAPTGGDVCLAWNPLGPLPGISVFHGSESTNDSSWGGDVTVTVSVDIPDPSAVATVEFDQGYTGS
ncbi:hypothetical protein DYI20_08755 [Auritidibacter ignavus]|uniref:hypothetical protein n=1 Tax=Auritidibacter ignavus TaxID=678932 RepID=UPI000F012FA7|nr:hypothetical protein [Auritidibacter ignavus]RMX22693.1 hypothetical protein DYI20_08755 [Auritidibacter ignavus]WHS27195.1 hypothetical protein QM395_07225 [Auritidibacter ignavus]WHS34186.1 hypothetical protein QM403_07390 [Auritidibacter ignavus]